MVARGLLGPFVGTQHTLIECLVSEHETAQIPAADVLLCDSIVFAGRRTPRRAKNVLVYNLISPDCLDQMAVTMEIVRDSAVARFE